jgi:hypothetical protein
MKKNLCGILKLQGVTEISESCNKEGKLLTEKIM